MKEPYETEAMTPDGRRTTRPIALGDYKTTAATFHYRFVRIHPFDDGNGRMARLLMNLILIKHGYTVAIIPSAERERYLQELERADQTEELSQFIGYTSHPAAPTG